ncbi:putative peptide import ATP-binding protein BAB2_0817 [Bosea sp. 62]|uniref:ABC transporter ATP-binding protein n=1 Tax=unclassified Bosea (in: a-proteobacteria) TaxID=2653178 RepID=UPI001252EF36|nr:MULTISPECIES: ABC transporter ATP-binding protein [unclassified Bosea (in: a-proteobacteria)]CAD5251544.1 putative peptide import ATP-binding protein BAB2_0817 [Bosea sp. 21B]CAD5261892.1 putative peptide import ATP-binding protein BAB2_0817 [Bosea sp. 7B]CAD5272795.1 putative peptide import ATP-binding protein BAB2_0817 [Bosea sp. 46]VVT43536.1 putative enzyme [Bosea sp. EC-HK365B]VXB24571.1 putative peptide import ATP-binding protein BAB2_0817 [Bosea sp. 29B]
MSPALLSVEGLRVGFRSAGGGMVEAVRGVDFSVAPGEAVGIVGESGSGKSLSMLAVMRLLGAPARATGGRVLFDGEDLLAADERRMRALRGRDIAMVFQDPQSSLNPALTIGRQITDVVRAHRGVSSAEARRIAAEALERVGIRDAGKRLASYPHEFSGGMRQRALIAMAIACRPRLLIADEPTTALDVTVQAQIVDLIAELRRELGLAVVFISHNLQLVAEIVDRVVVMYGGKVVEDGPVEAIERAPRHPYTSLLKACVPSLTGPVGPLTAIEGAPPRLGRLPVGCPFSPRCPDAVEPCANEMPALVADAGHRTACWRPR